MRTAIIGHTGFVGSNIILKKKFSFYYNSSNISEIKNESFDLLISCGLSATKFLINKNPLQDKINIQNQKNLLASTKVNHIVHISSIDVYNNKIEVNENSKINSSELDHYGYNRFNFEKFIIDNFNNFHIIRLPMLFGNGLKKNVLYDLLNNQFKNRINNDSIFQWYNIENIWNDIRNIINKKINLINLISEPIKLSSINKKYFGYPINELAGKKPLITDIRSIHSKKFSNKTDYIYSKKNIENDLKKFIYTYKSGS